jgi:hypothetical protein
MNTTNNLKLDMSDLTTIAVGYCSTILLQAPIIPGTWDELAKVALVGLITIGTKLGLAWVEYKRKQWGVRRTTRKTKVNEK